MSKENQNLELRISLKGGRAPLINSERIRQLKIYAKETQKKIVRMEKSGNTSTQSIVLEKQLLLNIQFDLKDQNRAAINSEFRRYDYFPKYSIESRK